MTQLRIIVQYLDSLLENQSFKDSALNGLQVDGGTVDIQRVAVAVDAAESIIERAAAGGCQLLIVHHGLFWGRERAITKAFGRKVRTLMRSGLSLYASHLPLDAHPELGNNAGLARHFGVIDLEPFCEVDGRHIGLCGRLSPPQSLDELYRKALAISPGETKAKGDIRPLLLPFGPQPVERVGLVSGSGSLAISEAADRGLDLLISGEPKHDAYHTCQELKLSTLFAGHYRTETFGVKNLGAVLEKEFNVNTLFIDEDSCI